VKRRLVAVIAVLLTILAVGITLAVNRAESRPNVILISIDSLRPDHLGCYGYPRATSPFLDRLAATGALFETAVSTTSWTLPAHAALFTGLPDRVHGCSEESRWLARNRRTVAEAFREAGYRTVGFFSGPFLHPAFGLAQGFDEYHDCTSFSEMTIAQLRHTGGGGNIFEAAHGAVTNPIILEEVGRWLERHPDGPAFIFIHAWDVHWDYVPPAPYDTMFTSGYEGRVDGRDVLARMRSPKGWSKADVEQLKALYDGEIRWTDDTIQKIFDGLERHGRLRGAIVAVTADHGEAFYEHGLHGHRLSLFEEEIRIPLLLHQPGSIRPGMRIRTPVQITDIAPTLLDLAGVDTRPWAYGRSLVPLLENPDARWPEQKHVLELEEPAARVHLFGIRANRWKLVVNFTTGGRSVFDLSADPSETTPLDPETMAHPPEDFVALYEKKAKALQSLLRELPPIGERDTPRFTEMTKAQLRSLGYLK